MPKIKSASAIAEKWGRVTPQRVGDYEEGVRDPTGDWEAATKAAESSYQTGVQAAIQRKAFGKGVARAGNEKWQEKAISKGVQRFGPGVQVAQGDYEEGFAPFRDEIERTSIPNRFPAGDPRNMQRSAILAAALHAKKIGR